MSEAELISCYKSTVQDTSPGNVATTGRPDGPETATVPISTEKGNTPTRPTDGPVVPTTETGIQATSNIDLLLITIVLTATVCLVITIVGCAIFYIFIMRRRLQRSKRNSVALMRISPRNITGDWVLAKRPPTPVTPAPQTPQSTPPVRRVITVGNKVTWPSPYFGGNRRARSDVVSLRSDVVSLRSETESHRSHTGYEHRNGSELGTDDKRIVVWPRKQ